MAGALRQSKVLRRPCRSGAVWTAGPQEAGRGFEPESDRFSGGRTRALVPSPSRLGRERTPGRSPLVVQWLGLSTITAEGPGRTPDRGTKIAWWAKKIPNSWG